MKRYSMLVLCAMLLALVVPVGAQGDVPTIEVSDQVSLDATVTIDRAFSEGPGFIVIHAANADGSFGADIGHRWLNSGWNFNVQVPIDDTVTTPTLFAMLHSDTNEIGTYEFGTVEGADGPVSVDGTMVNPSFRVSMLHAFDQFVANNQVRVHHVVVDQPTWVVIHADADGGPGPVLGQTLVNPGANADVMVDLTGAATPVLWPMLHQDTGEAGVYEFGTVDGADLPLAAGDQTAVLPIWTVPHVRVDDQVVLHGEGFDMTGMEGTTPTLVAQSVLSQGLGFLVIHADANGAPGPDIGHAAVPDGLSTDVAIELNADGLTPVVWPMLHQDTGTVGTYEFGTVEGADPPVIADGNPLVFAVNAAPSLVLEDQALEGNAFRIASALIDAPGWIAVHSSVDGAPGPVIATFPLVPGLTKNIEIQVDPAQAGAQVFPMLHYDTGAPGVYEFGTVDGADNPVSVAGNVVVGPVNFGGGEGAAAEPTGLDGNALVSERCTVCHSRERIDNADKDEAGWTETVDRMISYGAQLNAEERQAVIDYLVATH